MTEKLFGILDIFCAVWLVLLQYSSLSLTVSWTLGLYLVIKAVGFRDIASWVDGICGIILVFAAYGQSSLATSLAIIWLLQKGILSLITLRNKH